MKKLKFISNSIILIIFSSALIVSCSDDKNGSTDTDNGDNEIPGYKLVWSDEFEGNNIDTSKWEHEVNAWGGGNNELQYYTARPENSYISNGLLHLVAHQEEYTDVEGTRYYTSARMRTVNKGDWKYGRFDIKAKLPYGQGLWPAIWMLPTNWAYGGWPFSGEIDIMELVGYEMNRVYGTLHYVDDEGNHKHTGGSYKLTNGDYSDDFHIYTLEWEENEFRWYVDDILFLTQTDWNTNAAEYPAPFDQKFHLLLNVAVGGNWPGDPDNTTSWPQEMVVDYVRVYEKE
ncbi:glycoside hydrolase family 16 protein [Bacteroidota bacterium]